MGFYYLIAFRGKICYVSGYIEYYRYKTMLALVSLTTMPTALSHLLPILAAGSLLSGEPLRSRAVKDAIAFDTQQATGIYIGHVGS